MCACVVVYPESSRLSYQLLSWFVLLTLRHVANSPPTAEVPVSVAFALWSFRSVVQEKVLTDVTTEQNSIELPANGNSADCRRKPE